MNFDSDQPLLFKDDTFGSAYSESLKVLRDAQIALAKAWTSETAPKEQRAKAATEVTPAQPARVPTGSDALPKPTIDKGAAPTATTIQEAREADLDQWGNPEEETQSVVDLARKRREENDDHFKQTQSSLTDLMVKLEAVTEGMKQVRRESLKIWGIDEPEEAPQPSQAN